DDVNTIGCGIFCYCLVSYTIFSGVLNNMLYTGQPDSTIIDFVNPGLYGYDENFAIDNSGFADVEFDQENKQVTITIPEGTTWHDGEIGRASCRERGKS